MRRNTTRIIHKIVGNTFWIENPNWKPMKKRHKLSKVAINSLPFSLYETQKRLIFNPDKILAVSTESVVALSNEPGKIDKFMFKFPRKMSIEVFEELVSAQIKAVTETLVNIAIPTSVSIKRAKIFKNPKTQVLAVTQTQPLIDLEVYKPLDVPLLMKEPKSTAIDKTARDLKLLLKYIDNLSIKHNLIPDIAQSAGNLRRSTLDGSVILIDVMPAHKDGSRLIGDKPDDLVSGFKENLANIQNFVGQFGS